MSRRRNRPSIAIECRLSAKDFAGLNADQAFKKVADAMGQYQDGVEKTALAQILFGKAGAALLPVLRDTAEAGDLVARTTTEQARTAEDYERTLVKLQAATNSVFKAIAVEVVPVLNAFAKTMLESAKSADGLGGSVRGLAADGSIRSWAEEAAKVVGFVVDAFDGVARTVLIVGKAFGAAAAQVSLAVQGEFKAAAAVGQQFDKDLDAILAKPQFSDRLAANLAKSHDAIAEPTTKKLNLSNVTAKAVDDSKALSPGGLLGGLFGGLGSLLGFGPGPGGLAPGQAGPRRRVRAGSSPQSPGSSPTAGIRPGPAPTSSASAARNCSSRAKAGACSRSAAPAVTRSTFTCPPARRSRATRRTCSARPSRGTCRKPTSGVTDGRGEAENLPSVRGIPTSLGVLSPAAGSPRRLSTLALPRMQRA